MMENNTLLLYNQQGLIPGPDEDESAFLMRVEACLNLKKTLNNESENTSFFKQSQFEDLPQEAFSLTAPLYDISPSWLPVIFSNYQLAPWHGGCAWIFQLQDPGPRLAFLQLRRIFSKQSTFLKIYRRDELAAHEISHVGRMMFDEKQFEEVLAYRSSSVKGGCGFGWFAWLGWFGPLVQSSAEIIYFLATIFVLLILDFYFLFYHHADAYFSLMPLKLIPLAMLTFAFVRLYFRQKTFQEALTNLEKAVGSPDKANHIVYRLTDQEIRTFARSSSNDILTFSYNQQHQSLRWKLIYLAYFPQTG